MGEGFWRQRGVDGIPRALGERPYGEARQPPFLIPHICTSPSPQYREMLWRPLFLPKGKAAGPYGV